MTRSLTFVLALVVHHFVMAQGDRKRPWFNPDHAKVQYAGSIGMFSAGAGYRVFKKDTELDIHLGFLPARYSPDPLTVAAIKLTQPLLRMEKKRWQIWPLTGGVYISYTFGNAFSTDLPRWYPDNYYWWSEAVRPNIFLGGSATRTTQHRRFTRLGFYYEVGTNELKLVSYVRNIRSLDVVDILHAAVGAKLAFGQ